MYNYFNFKKFNNQFLITNDFGRYLFLSSNDFKKLISNDIDLASESGITLKDNLFCFNSSKQTYIDKSVFHYRNAKNYLFSATALHIFVVTDTCNMNCCYCQAQNDSQHIAKIMDINTAKHASDIALSSPQKNISVEFQGGEPLLNFKVIKYVIEYMESNSADKQIQFSIVSNLTLLNDEMISFIKEHGVSFSTSIDGPKLLHNNNRPSANNTGTYSDVVISIEKLRSSGIQVGAIQTTTKESLKCAKQIIDTYLDLGFNNVFIRPLTPLGYAKQNWSPIGYTAEEFIAFYKECFDYLMQLNQTGYQIRENHAAIFLSKIINGIGSGYMELRSPCGASTGQIAYYYDGNVFTCDEGRMIYEMGNSSFKLGNVFEDSYDDLMNSTVCKAVCTSSVLEALPKCCDCVYQPYCGVCPVINYATENDIVFRRNRNYRCQIYSGILDAIFNVLQSGNKNEVEILRRWSLW